MNKLCIDLLHLMQACLGVRDLARAFSYAKCRDAHRVTPSASPWHALLWRKHGVATVHRQP